MPRPQAAAMAALAFLLVPSAAFAQAAPTNSAASSRVAETLVLPPIILGDDKPDAVTLIKPLLRPSLNGQFSKSDSFQSAMDAAHIGELPRLPGIPWLSFGVGVAPSPEKNAKLRMGGTIRFDLARFTTVTFMESAYDRFWHRVETSYRLLPNLRVGMIDDKDEGRGPRVEFFDEDLRLTIIGTTMFGTRDSANGSFGINIDF